MRKILFKAKSIQGEWLESETLIKGIYGVYLDWTTNIEINPETLCQFTGKYDKNHKPIFENDIIQYELPDDDGKTYTEKFIVRYSVEASAFEQAPMKECLCDGWIDSSCEVIGNIFDKE